MTPKNFRVVGIALMLLAVLVGGFCGATALYRHRSASSERQALSNLNQLQYNGDWDEVFGVRIRVKVLKCEAAFSDLLKTANPADPNLARARQNIDDGRRLLQESDDLGLAASLDETIKPDDWAARDAKLKADWATCTTMIRMQRIAEAHADLAQVYIDRYKQSRN